MIIEYFSLGRGPFTRPWERLEKFLLFYFRIINSYLKISGMPCNGYALILECSDKNVLSANCKFSLWCVPLIKSGSLNWPWSTKILGQFVTHMRKNWLWYWKLSVSVTVSLIKTITPDLKISRYIITCITARPVGLSAIIAIMSISTFKTAVILYIILVV